VAAIADRFAPAERGRPISILISASFVALVIATPVVAVLGEMGGWRLPFIVVSASIIGVWALQWYWLPEHPPVGRRFGFIAHFKEVGRNKGLWLVLLANFLSNCGPGDLHLPRRLSGAHLWNDTGRRCSTSGSGRGRSHFG